MVVTVELGRWLEAFLLRMLLDVRWLVFLLLPMYLPLFCLLLLGLRCMVGLLDVGLLRVVYTQT